MRSASYSTTDVRLSQVYRLIRRIGELHADGDVGCATVTGGAGRARVCSSYHSLSSDAEEILPRRNDLDCYIETASAASACCLIETCDGNGHVKRSSQRDRRRRNYDDRNCDYAEYEPSLRLRLGGSCQFFFRLGARETLSIRFCYCSRTRWVDTPA